MATEKATVEFILEKLGSTWFSARPMFGEYSLYADGKVVGLVCDDQLFVKQAPATKSLEGRCETGPPYPGAKPHYIIDEGQLTTLPQLRQMLLRLAASLPEKKPPTASRAKKTH